jgi:hypothetical protein
VYLLEIVSEFQPKPGLRFTSLLDLRLDVLPERLSGFHTLAAIAERVKPRTQRSFISN